MVQFTHMHTDKWTLFAQNPILFRFVGLDRLFGSHYDEYVIEYSDFETTVDATVFDYAKSEFV